MQILTDKIRQRLLQEWTIFDICDRMYANRKKGGQDMLLYRYGRRFFALTLAFALLLSGCGGSGVKETKDTTLGIDVARYQGTIDWEQVASSGVDFAMIRVGYRANADGAITEDSNARYNMQEAAKFGIPIGVYFFSTAVSEEEAEEEARWVAERISQYPITYPVVYDFEDFNAKRCANVGGAEATKNANAFLSFVKSSGYDFVDMILLNVDK